MANLPAAIAAAREALAKYQDREVRHYLDEAMEGLLAALDAAQGEAVAWLCDAGDGKNVEATVSENARDHHARRGRTISPLYAAPQVPPAAVPAANVTPMRQPRADLARLVESINAAVYANGDGLSVTEAIGALELAKLELLKEQEQ